MSEHHKTLSPSSFPAILQCACFESAPAKTSPDDYADLGTEMHEYCAALLSGKPAPAFKLMEMGDAEDCDYVVELIKSFCNDNARGGQIETEKRMELFDDEFNSISFGTADVVSGLVIGDIKSGLDYSADWEKHIPQIDFYSLCNMRDKKADRSINFIAFIKARKLIPFSRTYAEAQATVDCAVWRRQDETKTEQPCEYCKYCAKILTCPGINRRVAVVEKCFSDLSAIEKMLNPSLINDPAEMSVALSFSKITLSAYIKRLETIKKNIDESGLLMSETVNIPHYARIIKNGTKKIENIQKAFELSGMQPNDFFDGLTLSIPKLSKAYAKVNALEEKKARKKLEQLLKNIIIPGEEKVSLEFTVVDI